MKKGDMSRGKFYKIRPPAEIPFPNYGANDDYINFITGLFGTAVQFLDTEGTETFNNGCTYVIYYEMIESEITRELNPEYFL